MRGRIKYASTSELKGILTALRVTHTMHSNGGSELDGAHILRSDQDILFAIGGIGSIDLQNRVREK